MMKRNKIILAVLVLVGIGIGVLSVNPLRRSEENIRLWLFDQTPIGTSVDNVVKLVESKDWRLNIHTKDPTVVNAHLGHYWGIFRADVSARWYFDSNGRLSHIELQKDIDAL